MSLSMIPLPDGPLRSCAEAWTLGLLTSPVQTQRAMFAYRQVLARQLRELELVRFYLPNVWLVGLTDLQHLQAKSWLAASINVSNLYLIPCAVIDLAVELIWLQHTAEERGVHIFLRSLRQKSDAFQVCSFAWVVDPYLIDLL
jgi:hypothetical protein